MIYRACMGELDFAFQLKLLCSISLCYHFAIHGMSESVLMSYYQDFDLLA